MTTTAQLAMSPPELASAELPLPQEQHMRGKAAPADLANPRRWLALVVVSLAVIAVTADNTIVNVALPTLSRELSASTRQLQWMVDAYLLVFAGLLLPAGSLGDRVGRKKALIGGLLILGVASAAASLSTSLNALIVARIVMGTGAALVFPATLSIVTTTFTVDRERRIAVAIWSGMVGIGVILGPLGGGFLLEHAWWGSIFLINVPILVIAILIGLATIGESREHEVGRWDIGGAALSFASVTSLVFGVIEAPARGWLSWPTIASLSVGITLLAILIVWERRHPFPLLPLNLLSDRWFAIPVVVLGLVSFALFGFVFVATQYFQFVSGLGTFASGLRYTPFAVLLIVCAALSPKIVGRFGARKVIVGGLLLVGTGLAGTQLLSVSSGFFPTVFLAVSLLGAGMGLVTAPATEMLMSRAPTDRAGIASGMNDTARQLGGALGVAVMGSVFASTFTRSLGQRLGADAVAIPAEVREAVFSSPGMAMRYASSTGERAPALVAAIRSAFVVAMHTATWLAIGGAVTGAIVTGVALVARKPTGTASEVASSTTQDASESNRITPMAMVFAHEAQR
jgi:EmrB/QacA subfamily drug resistance transporter